MCTESTPGNALFHPLSVCYKAFAQTIRRLSMHAGVLAAQWQVAAMTSTTGPLPRCRELIQASLTAALEKARMELRAFPAGGVICVAGSLHAAAHAAQLLEMEIM